MLHYSRLQLMTVVTVPMVTIVLIWTVVIFHRNRKRWRCYDVATVAILVQSVLRNVSVVCYTVLQMIDRDEDLNFDYCPIFVWTFNSLHTFQASTLATLAVIVLFSVRLRRKGEPVKSYLTTAHVVYHLFCLTVLCACVGVAAILAKRTNGDFSGDFGFSNSCKLMPHEMDVKYNVFVTTLHVFLVCVSSVCCAVAFYHFCASKSAAAVGFEYTKKSSSDLSELTKNDDALYYDVEKKVDGGGAGTRRFANNREAAWNSDMSNISTTVSSTNSRRPCIVGRKCEEREYEEGDDGIGLESILPILTVCYLFSHIPIIILCLFPRLLLPWSVASAALCLGMLQDVLVPLSLGLVDTRFCNWVSTVYLCSERRKQNDKLPQVGLDGKFRPFGTQTQTTDVLQTVPQRQRVTYQTSAEPKFPITNGSLYTSIDGRLPVIHNYRRHKDRGIKQSESNLLNLDAHATYLKQQEQSNVAKTPKIDYSCATCHETKQFEVIAKRTIATSTSPQTTQAGNSVVETDINPTKSEVSLYEIDSFDASPKMESTDSEEDYFTDSMNRDENANDSLSSQSSYSITTEANCDFEFYQMNEEDDNNNNVDGFVTAHRHETFDYLRYRSVDDVYAPPRILQTFKPHLTAGEPTENAPSKGWFADVNHNFKIKRSNSKRSLESFKAYVNDEFYGNGVQRSFSYVDLDEKIANRAGHELQRVTPDVQRQHNGGSVPDLKKIFISEYL